MWLALILYSLFNFSSKGDTLIELGNYDTPDYAYSVFIKDTFAYIADGTYGIRAVNVKNPSSPAEVCFYNSGGTAEKTFVNTHNIYIAYGLSGLKILRFLQEGISENYDRQKDFINIPSYFKNTLKINYNLITCSNITFTLFDITGRIEYKNAIKQKSGILVYTAKDLPSGIYFVSLKTNNTRFTRISNTYKMKNFKKYIKYATINQKIWR